MSNRSLKLQIPAIHAALVTVSRLKRNRVSDSVGHKSARQNCILSLFFKPVERLDAI